MEFGAQTSYRTYFSVWSLKQMERRFWSPGGWESRNNSGCPDPQYPVLDRSVEKSELVRAERRQKSQESPYFWMQSVGTRLTRTSCKTFQDERTFSKLKEDQLKSSIARSQKIPVAFEIVNKETSSIKLGCYLETRWSLVRLDSTTGAVLFTELWPGQLLGRPEGSSR